MKKILKKIEFFSTYIKKWEINIIKNTKKDSKKKHLKDIKIFLKEKKIKGEKLVRDRYKNLIEEKNKNYASTWKNII